MSREWVGVQHARNLRGQSVEPVAHADRAARQVDLGARRKLDHAPVAFKAANTRRSARSLTKPSTRSRVPSTNSISITPTRSAIAGRGDVPAITAGPSSSARANTPIGTKSASSLPRTGATTEGSADAVAPLGAHAALRQLNTRLAFSPWRRATSATEDPGRKVSSTIRCFSSRDQERRDRPIDPAFVTARVNTADELNDADPAIHSNSVHQSIVDTNPTSSGTGELAASLTAPVGGQQLTLTWGGVLANYLVQGAARDLLVLRRDGTA